MNDSATVPIGNDEIVSQNALSF